MVTLNWDTLIPAYVGLIKRVTQMGNSWYDIIKTK